MLLWVGFIAFVAVVSIASFVIGLTTHTPSTAPASRRIGDATGDDIGYYLDFSVRLIYVTQPQIWIAQSTEWGLSSQDKDASRAIAALAADVVARVSAIHERPASHEVH